MDFPVVYRVVTVAFEGGEGVEAVDCRCLQRFSIAFRDDVAVLSA